MENRLSAAILGAGARGTMFAEKLASRVHQFTVTAICDINPEQLNKCKKILSISDEQLFDDEERFFEKKRADVMVIATYDKYHVRQCVRALKMGYDVVLEKPISDSREEIDLLLKTQKETGGLIVVCHELRYGTAFEKLGELLSSGVIGRLIAIDAMERVGYWHQAQAYVRIQSVRNEVAHPTILAKCSHDLDLIQSYAGAACETVTSIGDLTFFRKENAPEDSTLYCLDCPHMETCPYSAKRIYVDAWKAQGCPEFVWPFNKVSLKKPTTEEDLYEGLRTSYFGQCVFHLGNEKYEHVVDHQLVQMMFKNGVTATLKMVFAAEAGRRINLFGTYGELLLDERSATIEVRPFGEKKEIIHFSDLIGSREGHGGGDDRLVNSLYDIFTRKAVNRTSLAESVESHLIGISAEESRLNGGKLIYVHP